MLEGSGQTWALKKRYSDFEKFHLSLEGPVWTSSQPIDPPFPPKGLFPNVQRRAERLSKYVYADLLRLVNSVFRLLRFCQPRIHVQVAVDVSDFGWIDAIS